MLEIIQINSSSFSFCLFIFQRLLTWLYALSLLASVDTIQNLAARRLQVGENPTAATLIELIIDDIPLNTKQRLIVERVLSAALSWNGAAYDASKRDQNFLYVGGNAGVGKSQIITAIVAAMDLLYRKDEVILTRVRRRPYPRRPKN